MDLYFIHAKLKMNYPERILFHLKLLCILFNIQLNMKENQIHLEIELSVNSEILYFDWLDSMAHSLFTGGEAKISNKVNSAFTCWDGYITGTIKELETKKRVLHNWRTSEFKEQDKDSSLEVLFKYLSAKKNLFVINHCNLLASDV